MNRFLRPLLLLTLIACGKRGDPAPPVPIIPAATSDLVVTQRGQTVLLSWSYPSLTTAGTGLTRIGRIAVYRVDEDLPASLAGRDPQTLSPGESDPALPREIALFQNIPQIVPLQFSRLKVRIAVLESAEVPRFTAGARILYEDNPPVRTTDGRPIRYTYGVVTESSDEQSDLSNLATLIPLQAPMPPNSLTAVGKAEGVVISWNAPDRTADAPSPTIAGYNVYRFAKEGPIVELGKPVNSGPIAETSFTDVPPYGAHRYLVTTVASPGPPAIESEPTASILAEFRDLMPPPAPANVNTLAEERRIRIVWDAVEAGDLAGYRVYRSPGGGVGQLLTVSLVTEPNFMDESATPGVKYVYSVSSVDSSGNESAATPANEAMIPR